MLLITSVFDFLDIAIVNSKILHHNTDSAPLLSTTDFRYCTVLHKRRFSIFQARKEQFPGQQSNQLENTLVIRSSAWLCHLSSLLCIMCKTKKMKAIHLFDVPYVTWLCAFKKNGITSKTFIQNETFHLLYSTNRYIFLRTHTHILVLLYI